MFLHNQKRFMYINTYFYIDIFKHPPLKERKNETEIMSKKIKRMYSQKLKLWSVIKKIFSNSKNVLKIKIHISFKWKEKHIPVRKFITYIFKKIK